MFVRTLAKYLGPKMGVNFAIENVTGGSGARAVARVAQAPADGSMLYVTTPTYIQTTLLSKPQFGYDSLMPVVTVFYDPEVLYVRAQSPHRTLADAIESAKKSQGKARWGAANPASLERIAMERLNRVTQARAIVVSYEGGRDQMLNVLNGTLDLGIGEIQEMVSQIEAGQVRLLATLTAHRLPGLPGAADGEGAGRRRRRHQVPRARRPEEPAARRAQGLAATAIKAVLADPGVPEGVSAARASCRRSWRTRKPPRSPRASPATSAVSLRELGVIK